MREYFGGELIEYSDLNIPLRTITHIIVLESIAWYILLKHLAGY